MQPIQHFSMMSKFAEIKGVIIISCKTVSFDGSQIKGLYSNLEKQKTTTNMKNVIMSA